MKSFVCVVVVLALNLAVIVSGNYLPAAVNTGASSQYRSQDNLGQYSFGYDEAGATGGSFRHEKSDAYGVKTGSYGLRGADGKVRVVNYVADANGFRANIQTNEAGTEPRNPAAVSINEQPALAVPVPVAAAPLAFAAPVPAPVPVAAAAPLPLPAPAPVAFPAYGAAPLVAPLPALAPPAAFGYGVVSQHFAPAALPVPY